MTINLRNWYSRVCLFALVAAVCLVPPPSIAATNAVTITVHVRAAGGEPIPDVYVALVPIWRPLSHPLVEAIASNGTWVARAPSGKYRLVAGAKGFALSSQGPVSVSPNDGANVSIELSRLKNVMGNVSDELGNPLAGVRVAGTNAIIPPPLGTLSPLAFRHLASDWSATTDKNGSWTLGLPAGTTPLVYEAPRFAVEWRLHKAGDAAALDVAMKRGAALHLITDRSDSSLVVTLVREDSDGAGVPSDWQRQIWARWASATTLTWDSLQPGNYVIYAKYPDPRFFMPRAVKLTSVKLSPSEFREVRVTLPPALTPTRSFISMFLENTTRSDFSDVEVFGADDTGAPYRVDAVVEEVSSGIVLHLKEAKEANIRAPLYAITAQRYVALAPEVAEGGSNPDAEPPRAVAYPRADVHLVVRSAEKDLRLPRGGKGVLDCGQTKRVTVPVEIREEQLAHFTAPADCRSLVLFLDPFEPILVETPLKAGDQSLGNFLLRASATADIHVVREPGGASVSGATVRVMARSGMAPRASVIIEEAIASDDGWAHFSMLPGFRDLRLTAQTTPDESSGAAEIRLEPHSLSVVDPLVISKPAEIIVEPKLAPAFRARFPTARIVSLFVRPADAASDPAPNPSQNVGEETSFRFGGLRPGMWRVRNVVKVAGTYTVGESEEIELKAGESRRYVAMINPLVFEGRIIAGGKGVAARIAVVDPTGTGASRLYFDSDGRGTFSVVLPMRGIYSVEVARLSAQGDVIPVGDIDFSEPDRPIEIAIPEGRAAAHVSTSGRPVEEAVVTAMLRSDGRGTVQSMEFDRLTDSSGDAAFDGLTPGVWTFSVQDQKTGRSAAKALNIGQGDVASVDLKLDWTAAVKGTVHDPGGLPLPNARVECLYSGVAGIPIAASVSTDSEGKFAVDLNEQPAQSAALCSVTGPMGNVDAFKATSDQAIDVAMPAATAALRVSGWYQEKRPDIFWLVAGDGRVISLSSVAAKIGRFGEPLVIPRLASGRWKLVQIESLPQWIALGSGMAGSLRGFVDFALEAGGSETINLNSGSAR